MNLYNRLSQYHSDSRPSFVLFSEFIAFAGSMATIGTLPFYAKYYGDQFEIGN